MANSKTLTSMLYTGKGYRNEGYSASPYTVPTLEDMLHGEIEESGNTDIIDYIHDNYGYTVTSVADVMRFVTSETGVQADNLHALWLTSMEGVKDNYVLDEEYTTLIVTYAISKVRPLLVLSDLDNEGALLVTVSDDKGELVY